jgi:hypothetical protein
VAARTWLTEHLLRRGWVIPCLLVLLNLYGLDRAKPPWYDDTLHAAPGYYLFAEGRLCYAFEPGVAGLDRIALRMPPLGSWVQAAWFSAVGFSAYTLRILYLLCAAGTVVLVGVWVRRTLAWRGASASHANAVALLAMAILATDRLLVWTVRAGRPEPLALLFAWGGLVVACRGAEAPPVSALRLAFAGALAAAAVMVHPTSALVGVGVVLQHVAQHGWRGRGLLALCAGGLIGLAPWFVLVAQHADLFETQFLGNSAYHRSEVPFPLSLRSELLDRWRLVYMWAPVHLVLMWLGVALGLARLVSKRDPSSWCAVLALAHAGVVALVLRKQHHPYYLSLLIPTFVAAAAVALSHVESPRSRRFGVGLVALAVVNGLVLQALYPYVAWVTRETRSQARLEAFLRETLPANAVVAGPVELWFAARRVGLTYYLSSLHSHVMDFELERVRYRAGLRERPVEFVVFRRGEPGALFPRARLLPIAELRLPGPQGEVFDRSGAPDLSIPDPPVWYTIYTVAPR